MATVALSGIITPSNVVTATSTTTLTNKTLTGAVMNGTLGATTPSTVVATTVKASTTMGVGGATPSASGSGISFPADQSILGASSDANTLDDYEEGTFTPTITGGTTNPTVTYNANTAGFYTKIGDRVFVNLFVGATAISGGSGELRVALPFTPKNSTGNYAHGATQFRGTSFSWGSGKTQGDSYTTPNVSFLRFQGLANSTSNYDIVVSDFGAGSVIEVTISYFV